MNIQYNTELMHQVGTQMQSNGDDMLGDLRSFWARYELDMYDGTFSTFSTCLASFQSRCQDAANMLARGRVDLGSQLNQFASELDQEEARLLGLGY